MSLQSAADARRVAALSRQVHERLLAYLEQLPPDGWTEQSACADWQVYQVVAHISSQPEIVGGVIRAGLFGAPPMTDQQRRAIWDHFDSLGPLAVLPEFRARNASFYQLIDGLDDQQLATTINWVTGPTPLAGVLAARLNEQALHEWDVRWARDRAARLDPASLAPLLEINTIPPRLNILIKPERAEALSGQQLELRLREPAGQLSLQLTPGAVSTSASAAEPPALVAELPGEACVRLLWGRYDVAAGLASGELRLSRPELAEALQALFPGR